MFQRNFTILRHYGLLDQRGLQFSAFNGDCSGSRTAGRGRPLSVGRHPHVQHFPTPGGPGSMDQHG